MDSDIQITQSDQSASSSTSVLDNASSLRAAALLSRKRRKVTSETPTLPPRFPPEPSLQLDYGQEGQDDSSLAQQSERKSSPVPQLTTTPVTMNQMEDIEDGQIREEGEISDSETSPPQRRSPTPPSRTRQRPSAPQPHFQETARPEIPLPPRPPSRVESEAVSPSEQIDPGTHSWQPVASTSVEPFVFETSTYRLDANHVRPGLAMTQEQYNIAKDIVLDLLGWGVPPEYLLECGLSRHVIYYVFSELNLRLPSNLDISGLIPYPTPEMLALIPVSPSLSARSLHSSSSAMPPPSVIPARASLAERMSMERIDTELSSPDRSPYVKPEPSSPSSVDLSNSHSLLMIEQQRRQELLARKAVIASRKARQSEPPGLTSSKDQDVDISAVPSQSVDDFLKTIEPPPHLDVGDLEDHNRISSVGTTPLSEGMDVDEPIPGLIGMSRDTSTFSAGPSSTQSLSSASTATYAEPDLPATFYMGSTVDVELSNNGLHRAATTPVDTSDSHIQTLQGNPSFANLDGDSSYPQRRGTKRPVAADFVDFDGPGSSRGYGNSSSNGYSNGGGFLSRRKTGSFAGITGSRRCVIELSDSEDDGDSHVRGDYVGNGDTREYSPVATPGFSARNPQRLGGTPTMPAMAVSNGNSVQSAQSSLSTNALAEKEEEIKRMRQLIAQREELRLKKLAAMSGKSTPVNTPANEAQGSEATATVKQEEVAVTSFGPHGSRTSRDREIHCSSIMDSTSRHGTTSVAVSDGNTQLLSTDNSATGHSLGSPGSAEDRNGLFLQETSTTGREHPSQDDDSEDEQDLMITGEAQTSQVIIPSSRPGVHQESSAAGDSGTSSSAQVLRQQLPQSRNETPLQSSSRSSFPLYDSPLSGYPFLRSRFGPESSPFNSSLVASLSEITTASHASASSSSATVQTPSPISFTTPPSFSVSSHSSSPITLPDLKLLKQAVVNRSLAQLTRQSAGLRVCQYEVPGGGVCRDKDCEELHLSRIAVDPSDTEVASYVHEALPRPWNGRCDVRAIEIALEGVRLRGSGKDVDDRVREALAGLGIPIN